MRVGVEVGWGGVVWCGAQIGSVGGPGQKATWTDQKLIVRKAKAKGDADRRKVNS